MIVRLALNFFLAILFLFPLIYPDVNVPKKENTTKEPLIREFNFETPVKVPPKKILNLPPPNASTTAAIAVDLDSTKILYEKNKNLRVYPASTTKMMTALLAVDLYQKNQIFVVDKIIEKEKKNNFFVGEKILFKDLLKALLISSSNDAAEILARNHPSGREGFITDMNKKANELSLNNTHFVNPTGFDSSNHYTSAFDLALLAKKFAENDNLLKISSSREEIVSNLEGTYFHNLKNTNILVGKNGVLGIKTGWTEISRGSLVALVEQEGHKIITVVLKSEDRFTDTEELLTWTFSSYRW